MADEEDLTIKATVNASGVVSGAQQAVAAFNQMQAAASALQAATATAATNINAAAAQLGQVRAAATTAAAGLTTAATAATTTATAVGGIAPAAAAATAAVGNIAPVMAQATNAMGGFRAITAGSLREFIVLGHEALVGNFSRIPGSLLVLGERVGGLQTVLAGVSAATLGFGAAGVAAIGTLAYLAYQEFETERAIDSFQGKLIAQGRGFEETKSTIRGYIDALKDATGLWGGEARTINANIGVLPPEIAGQRAEILKQLVQFGQATGKSGKELDEFAKTAGHDLGSVAGAMKLLEETTGPASVAFREQVTVWERAGEPGKALVAIVGELLAKLGATTGVLQDGKKAWDDYSTSIARIAGAAGETGAAISAIQSFKPPEATESHDRDRQAEAMRHFMSQAGGGFTQAQAAGIVGTLTQESGPGLSTTMENASGHAGIAQWSKERQAQLGVSASSSFQEQLAAITRELQGSESVAGARLRTAQTPAEAAGAMGSFERPEGFGSVPNEQLYGGRAVRSANELYSQAGRADPAQQDAERVTDKILKSKQQMAVLDEQIATLSAIPNRNADQEEALDTAKLERMRIVSPLMKEELEARKASLEQQKLSATSDGQRLEIQKQINQVGDQLKGGTPSSAAHEQLADMQAQRVAEDEATRAKIIGLQTQLAQTTDLKQQLDLKKQIAGLEATLGRGSATSQAQQRLADAQAERQYSQETIRDAERAADAQVRVGQSSLGLIRAQQGELVALRQRTETQASEAVLKATDEEAHAEEKLFTAIAERSGATEAVKQRMYERIAEVATHAAEMEIQQQKRVADEMRKSAETAAKPFVSAFDSVGDSSERAFNSVVTGASKGRQAMLELERSITGDLLKSIERLASQQLAKGVGSLIGVTPEKGGGLGSVLGAGLSKGVSSLFGGSSSQNAGEAALQDAASKAASSLTTASEAQTKLNELLGLSSSATTTATAATTASAGGLAIHSSQVNTNTGAFVADSAAVQGNATAQAAGATGGAASGIGSFLKGIPLIGGLFSLARGGIIPSAAGGWALPNVGAGGTLAQLHANEMVLPADISQGLQGMIGGGGGGGATVHNWNIQALDGQSVAKVLRSNAPALVAALNAGLRNGSSLRAS